MRRGGCDAAKREMVDHTRGGGCKGGERRMGGANL